MNRRAQRGIAAVEMALLSGFLLLLAGGVAELGHALYTYDSLAKAARSGARYIAMRDRPIEADEAVMRAEAVNVTLCGAPACGGSQSVVPGLTAAHILVQTPFTTPALANVPTGIITGSLDAVTVTVSPPQAPFSFQPWVAIPFFGPLNIQFGPIRATMPRSS